MAYFFYCYGLETVTEKIKNTGLRRGQILFNLLHDLRPDLALRLAGQTFDPFYFDDVTHPVMMDAFTFILENW